MFIRLGVEMCVLEMIGKDTSARFVVCSPPSEHLLLNFRPFILIAIIFTILSFLALFIHRDRPDMILKDGGRGKKIRIKKKRKKKNCLGWKELIVTISAHVALTRRASLDSAA